MGAHSPVGLSLEQLVERLLFVPAEVKRQALDVDLPLGVILDAYGGALLVCSGGVRDQVEQQLVVDLHIGDTDCEVVIVRATADLLEDLTD